MTSYRLYLAVTISILLLLSNCFAQKKRAVGSEVIPDKIREMNFDSVFVLASDYPKSPLIIGYRRVLHLDTNDYISEDHPNATIDSTYLYHGKLFDRQGNSVLPHTIYRREFFQKPGCSRALMIVLTSDFWYGYDYPDSTHPPEYLFDVMKTAAIDSGGFEDFGSERYLLCSRSDGRKNLLDPCDGYVYRYDDPFTLIIQDIWYHKGVLRLLTSDAEGRKIYDIAKRQVVPVTWNSYHEPILSAKSPVYSKNADTRIYYYDYNGWGWQGVVDPATGYFGPEYVLNFQYGRWWFCEGYESGCIASMRLEGMQNRHPLKRINRAKIRLTLTDKASNQVVYKQNHWVDVGLEPGEVGATQEFKLNQQVFIAGDLMWNAEVVEYK